MPIRALSASVVPVRAVAGRASPDEPGPLAAFASPISFAATRAVSRPSGYHRSHAPTIAGARNCANANSSDSAPSDPPPARALTIATRIASSRATATTSHLRTFAGVPFRSSSAVAPNVSSCPNVAAWNRLGIVGAPRSSAPSPASTARRAGSVSSSRMADQLCGSNTPCSNDATIRPSAANGFVSTTAAANAASNRERSPGLAASSSSFANRSTAARAASGSRTARFDMTVGSASATAGPSS